MSRDEWLPSLPPDPRLLNLDNDLIEIIFEHFKGNVNLVGIHLRDARNMLPAVKEDHSFDRVYAKAVVILAAAALEANLAYLSDLCLAISAKRPGLYVQTQLDYLRGSEEYLNDKGDIRTRPLKQRLEEKLKTVPSLLGRAMGRDYEFPPSASATRKLRETIAYRDAIVHPRWDRYAQIVGWYEAAQAIDAVELYLDSISSQLHPYLAFYFPMLYTIPPGGDKDDVDIAHRTKARKNPRRGFSNMAEISITEIISREWLEAQMLTEFALTSQCEGDSDGSMLTRAALVLLYAMLDAQLSVIAQAYLHNGKFHFEQPEVLFFTEMALGVDTDGEITATEGHQHFKQRVVGIPRVLARRVLGKEITVSLGDRRGEDLLRYKDLRDEVMHPYVGKDPPRVSKDELRDAEKAIQAYFAQLAVAAPELFRAYDVFLKE
jgi:hypothetical protein